MAAGKYNILVQQGATFFKQVSLKDVDGVPVDLTGATIQGQIRENYDSDTSIAFSTSITDEAGGVFTLTIADETTSTITFDRGVYDVEVHYLDGTVDRLLQGSVVVSKEVTK